MLQPQSLTIASGAAEWELIEHKLIRMGEPSHEPRHQGMARPQIRPRFWAFLHDVGLLYARHLALAFPAFRLVPADAGMDRQVRTLSPYPRLTDKEGRTLRPIDDALTAGYGVLHGGYTGLLGRGFDLAAQPVEDIEHQVRSWLAEFRRDNGRHPTGDELADFFSNSDFAVEDVPPQLAKELGIDS